MLQRYSSLVIAGLVGVATLGSLGLSTARADETDKSAALRKRVLAFAKSKVGQEVGNGECWTLAFEALSSAGAKRPGMDGLTVYRFGRSFTNLKSAKPGDILQFENVTFKHTSSNGSWSTSSYPHHTAVVERVSGSRIYLLNQNVNGNRTVQESVIDLNDRQAGGSITGFTPEAR